MAPGLLVLGKVLAGLGQGDAAYGADSKLRLFLEESEHPYALAVSSQQSVGVDFSPQRVKTPAAQVPAEGWRLRAGAAAKGPRAFLSWWPCRSTTPTTAGAGSALVLLRRSCNDPEDVAFYLALARQGTRLEALARVAGRCWAIEEAFAQDKGEVGLDQYEVRS